MIEIKNLTKIFGTNFKAVNDLNLEIKSGEIFGFLGPNGAGKTTTLKMMVGITNPSKGDIIINGKSIIKENLEAKKEFGFVPDSPDVFLRLTGLEYLNFMAAIYDINDVDKKDRIKTLSEKFEMTDALTDRISSYSHGMRQKIVIIGVLMHKPPVWILDEPLTGLDPKSSFILKEMMREHADQGNTVLFSTHVLDTAEKICDRVGIISKGKLIYVGTIEELKNNENKNESLEELFLELVDHA